MDEDFQLSRFVEAQAAVFPQVVAELTAGRKTSHWMWFVFPQIAGLGHSPMSIRYALGSLAEAEAYLRHALLGPRLRHCTGLALAAAPRSARELFGRPDDMKFRSSMTLFANAEPGDSLFAQALRLYFDAAPDPATIERLGR